MSYLPIRSGEVPRICREWIARELAPTRLISAADPRLRAAAVDFLAGQVASLARHTACLLEFVVIGLEIVMANGPKEPSWCIGNAVCDDSLRQVKAITPVRGS